MKEIALIDTLTTSYVALLDLIDCLDEYFNGDLNEIPTEYYDRLWLPLKDVIPNNSLKSQIDSDTMSRALFTIPDIFYFVIYHRYAPDDVTLEMVQIFYSSNNERIGDFVPDDRTESIEDFLNRVFIEALFSLSQEILTIL